VNHIFILENDKKTIKVIETTKQVLERVENILQFDIEKYKANATVFDGSYKPDDDECLKIENFKLPFEINNTLSIDKLSGQDVNEFDIRAIFLLLDDQNSDKIIFQRTQKKQLLKGGKLTLFFDRNTFVPMDKPGVVISNSIDAYYENRTLYFKSYYWANQIFDLNDYYRQATDKEIREFYQTDCFCVEDLETLVCTSSNSVRKKVAYILDKGILEKNTPQKIFEVAEDVGLKLEKNDENKIVFPTTSESQKQLISFLANEIYKGYFTDDVFLTNSKRALKK